MIIHHKTCFLILFIAMISVFALQCPKNKKCHCITYSHQDHLVTNCTINSNFEIHILRGIFMMINCNNLTEWPDFNLNTAYLRIYWSIHFNNCNFPNNIKVINIVRMLGAADSEQLHIISYNWSLILKEHHLDGFKNLKYLSLHNVSHIDKNLLTDLKQLTDLQLSENNLQHLAIEFFDNTPQLNTLDLSMNNLTLISPSTFDKLKILTTLYIEHNNLIELHPEIFDKLVSLENLKIAKNKLINLPKDLFKALKNLKILYLSENNFTDLPKDLLRNNTELLSVYLNSNRKNLTLLDGFFSNLEELKYLELRSNGLRVLPEDLLWGSFKLESIDFSDNYIKSWPLHIFRDSINLLTLKMNSNNIEVLPDYIFKNTSKIETLDLSSNCITSITKQLFNKLHNLKLLNMKQNCLKYISNHSFKSLKNLKIVDLSNNHLTLQSDDKEFESMSLFHDCFSLEELYLANNSISKICNDWIKHNNLKILDLSYNNISCIKAENLLFVSNNITVDFTHNKIEHIFLHDAHNNIAIGQKYEDRIVIISVQNNPLSCDCKMYDFLRYMEDEMHLNGQNYFHIKSDNLTCHSPEELKNIRIDDLSSKNLTCRVKNTDSITVCPERCDCFLRPKDKMFIFDCSHKNLTNVPSDIKKPDISLIQNLTSVNSIFQFELNFSKNRLTQMPFLKQLGLGSVKTLTLSHNNISEILLDGLSETIEILELHNNNLKEIYPDVLKFLRNSNNLIHLTLYENPWKCNCDTRDFLHFIQTKYRNISDISKLSQVICNRNRSISYMTFNDFCPINTTVIISISTAIALIGLIIGILGLYYKYQKHIKIWLFAHQWCLWVLTEDELDKDKLYDAFVSFSHKDHDFIVDELVPKLESGPTSYKLCLHYRDWLIGEWISENIVKSVENSRRTIVVLSPNFLESVWGRMEFRVAHCQALSEGRARVILILYGDIGSINDLDPELKAYITMNTYVQWGDPWFWDKLRYALPHQSRRLKSSRTG